MVARIPLSVHLHNLVVWALPTAPPLSVMKRGGTILLYVDEHRIISSTLLRPRTSGAPGIGARLFLSRLDDERVMGVHIFPAALSRIPSDPVWEPAYGGGPAHERVLEAFIPVKLKNGGQAHIHHAAALSALATEVAYRGLFELANTVVEELGPPPTPRGFTETVMRLVGELDERSVAQALSLARAVYEEVFDQVGFGTAAFDARDYVPRVLEKAIREPRAPRVEELEVTWLPRIYNIPLEKAATMFHMRTPIMV